MKEEFSIPYVAAIIVRVKNGKKEILIQTRNKPDYDPKYTGAFEIPAGRIRKYENIFDALKREVKEETGLKLKKIYNEPKAGIFRVKEDETLAFTPFCCAQVIKAPQPYIGFYFICEVINEEARSHSKESLNQIWVSTEKLKKMINKNKNEFYVLHIAALKLYLGKNMK